jgi:hypothetical protein
MQIHVEFEAIQGPPRTLQYNPIDIMFLKNASYRHLPDMVSKKEYLRPDSSRCLLLLIRILDYKERTGGHHASSALH